MKIDSMAREIGSIINEKRKGANRPHRRYLAELTWDLNDYFIQLAKDEGQPFYSTRFMREVLDSNTKGRGRYRSIEKCTQSATSGPSTRATS